MVMIWICCHDHEAAFKAWRLALRVGFFLKVAKTLWVGILLLDAVMTTGSVSIHCRQSYMPQTILKSSKYSFISLQEFWLCICALLLWENKDESEPLFCQCTLEISTQNQSMHDLRT